MYKLLLSWRYLRTRYIVLASIVSVTLGVATMIVVNSVMSGFTTEMRNRIHGILSDIVFESRSMNGFADSNLRMEEIRKIAGEYIEAMTPTVVVPAMLNFQVGDQTITRAIELIGIDPETQGAVSDFSTYLQHPANRKKLSFDLRLRGYDTTDHQAGADTEGSQNARRRGQMEQAGMSRRIRFIDWQREMAEAGANRDIPQFPQPDPAGDQATHPPVAPVDPFANVVSPDANPQSTEIRNPYAQHAGLIMESPWEVFLGPPARPTTECLSTKTASWSSPATM